MRNRGSKGIKRGRRVKIGKKRENGRQGGSIQGGRGEEKRKISEQKVKRNAIQSD